MKLEKVIKKIITIVAILLLGLVFALNIFLISSIPNSDEFIWIRLYGILGIVISGLIAIGIYVVCNMKCDFSIKFTKSQNKYVNITDKHIKIAIAIIMIIAYIVGQIIWINYRNSYPVYDQQMTYNAARSLYERNGEYILRRQYFELYPQQLTTAKVWSIIFNIFGSSNERILQYLNVFANCLSLLAIYLITKELSKKHSVNKFTPLMIYMTFLTVPMLSTFVYGDEQGMAMALLSVYFIMKYGTSNKYRYVILSAIFMAISYALRMNNLIWILAIMVYLVLNLLKKDDNVKDDKKAKKTNVLVKLSGIVLFIMISIIPATLIKSSMQTKYELNKENKFPVIGFLCMGMQDGPRSCGWYEDETASLFWEDADNAKLEYQKLLKERITYFIHNPVKMAKFYTKKTASMWTENTYSAIWYNQSFNIGKLSKRDYQKDEYIQNKGEMISIYQKALVLIIFGISIMVIVENKDNLSNELLLLLTIFIGGFLFHTIWEAKSRYIISYIVALIPITSICLKSKNNLDKKTNRKDAI